MTETVATQLWDNSHSISRCICIYTKLNLVKCRPSVDDVGFQS